MITKHFYPQDKAHSLLGFGGMRFAKLPDGNIDEVASAAMIDRAIAGGVNYFDTAYYYHDSKSEAFLKKALAKYPRESYLLADKMPVWSVKTPEDLERIFNDQLERCGVDYFDYYLAHSLDGSKAEAIRNLGIMEFFQRKKAEGKIRRIGFSFHDDLAGFHKLLEIKGWEFCQLQLNYADWNRFKAAELYAAAAESKLPVIVMEPVRGGFLANPPQISDLLKAAEPQRSLASWAFRFVASLPAVTLVLSGMSAMEQLEDNLTTFADESVYLNADEQRLLAQAMTILDNIKTVPCTGCNYCMPCPS
ncbi:MAG: aldo/keto reductase, partial [Angelakisella sp.]